MSAASLRSEGRAMLAIVRLALNWRGGMSSNWVTWLFLAAALLGFPAVLAETGDVGRAIGMGLGIPLGILAGIWWVILMNSVLLQNAPASRLVPGMLRRSIAALALVALLGTIVFAGLFALGQLPFVDIFAGGAALTCGYVMVMVWPKGFGHLVSLGLIAYWLRDGIALPAHGSGLSFALIAGCALPLFLAQRYINRDWLLAGMGPGMRLGWMFWPLLPVAALTLGYANAPDEPGFPVHAGIFLAALLLQGIAADMLANSAYRQPGEQALLRLAPRAAPAAAFNAMLGRALLLRFAGAWLTSTGAAMVLAALVGASTSEILRMVPVLCMPLLNAVMVLRDYSTPRMRSPGMIAFNCVWIGFATAAMITALRSKFSAAAAVDTMMVTLLLAVVLGRWRWNRMLAAPPAFPAGRIAKT